MTTVGVDQRTNVRVSPVALAAIRATFGILERVAPGPGAGLAERIWCHVPRPGRHLRRDLRPNQGARITATVRGRRVVAEVWGNGPAVYLSAGWGGRRGQLGALVHPLVTAGFRVIAFDPLSHGESDPGAMGRRASTLSEFADSLTAVANEVGPARAVVAHSAGCIAAGLAVRDGLSAERLVFIAPMADPLPYIDDFCHTLGVGNRVRAGMVGRLERRVGRRLHDFDLLRLGPRLRLPLLVVHDRQDKEARFSDGEAIAVTWPGADFMSTSGLGHRRILTDHEVVTRVTDFVVASGRPGMSGPAD